MNNLKNFSFIVISVFLIMSIYMFGVRDSIKNQTFGGVAIGNEYQATTTYSKLGVPLFTTAQQIISNTPGTLGSVIITGAVAGQMRFMNATSTTDVSSTTVAVFPASTAVGTYVFDLVLTRGLVVESGAGLTPTTTITFRNN